MDEDGRRDGPAVTTLPVAAAPAARIAVVAGRLDDWWDPAWDAAWWDPVWDAGRSADAGPVVLAGEGPGEAAAPAGPGACPDVAREPPPEAPADPSWGQVVATTISLWMSRRVPRVRIRWRPGGTRLGRSLRRPYLRSPRFGAWGSLVRRVPVQGLPLRGMPARALAVCMLGAGLLAVGAGTAGLLVASGSPSVQVRWPTRPSPVPVPAGRTGAPAWLATVQQTARPVWLTVPAIGVRTRLVDLGLNRNGTLQVPASTEVAGWFTGSPLPGAVGSAVIAGHVDSRTGPAVFFWLRALRPGERIYVGRADGTLAVFTVTDVLMYQKDEFPTAAVYGPVPDAELRLITCGGIFDKARRSYLSNVVVYARLTG
jgi:Sortase domain